MWAAQLFQAFLNFLYDEDVLDESVILRWHSREHGNLEDPSLEKQRKQLKQQVGKRWCDRYNSLGKTGTTGTTD